MEAAVLSATTGVKLKEGGPFGACITRNDVVVCCAHNTFFSDRDPTCHAEMNAIRMAMHLLKTDDLAGCVIYSSFEPCPMCWGAILASGIRLLYVGLDRHTAAKNGVEYLGFYDAILDTKESISPMMHINPPASDSDEKIISMLTSPEHCIIVNKDNKIIADSSTPSIESFTDSVDTLMVKTIRLACRAINSPYLQGCKIFTLEAPDVESHAACLWALVDSLHYCSEALPGSR
ncbi:conserved hypothetical protein [Perkinsus marinus ATCC 50983]|uniref:CMP/dCMP-type deaminase domain-containing protein n=1 Tax=Perkinsus marinus (strain ATCC 50983 / TXsc) TaxID=423536 RepID=C5KAE5_PERM5|nr:conserved hypothetical protein [Perkinsus marinus ATCC 50983]EER18606.1 conserved hypothetical protein [Perkinsus marinus ATCC 50983]|eukprot:XP_002786810.1 conserved hypothetical protein [Perkinsus marinus ATCC 50983]